MRIISGKYRGKKLTLPYDNNTRPLRDLVKESIFNLIKHSKKKIKIEGAFILDLFSGSGSFGLECISRGAKKVYFIENYPNALKVLEKNIKSINGHNNSEILKYDIMNYFNSKNIIDKKFDIIFLDPPFRQGNINDLLETLIDSKFLKSEGYFILHRHKKDQFDFSDKVNVFEHRIYGISNIIFAN